MLPGPLVRMKPRLRNKPMICRRIPLTISIVPVIVYRVVIRKKSNMTRHFENKNMQESESVNEADML